MLALSVYRSFLLWSYKLCFKLCAKHSTVTTSAALVVSSRISFYVGVFEWRPLASMLEKTDIIQSLV